MFACSWLAPRRPGGVFVREPWEFHFCRVLNGILIRVCNLGNPISPSALSSVSIRVCIIRVPGFVRMIIFLKTIPYEGLELFWESW